MNGVLLLQVLGIKTHGEINNINESIGLYLLAFFKTFAFIFNSRQNNPVKIQDVLYIEISHILQEQQKVYTNF